MDFVIRTDANVSPLVSMVIRRKPSAASALPQRLEELTSKQSKILALSWMSGW